MYYVWKLLYRGLLLLFKVIFSGSLSGVLFGSLDGKCALFANVLCDIAICAKLNFEWKHSYNGFFKNTLL